MKYWAWKSIVAAIAFLGVLSIVSGTHRAESLDAVASQTIPADATPTVEIATKDFVRAEINGVRAEINGVRAEISQSESRLIRWMIGTGIGIAAVVIGAMHYVRPRTGDEGATRKKRSG